MPRKNKTKTEIIEWRTRSQWKYLPQSDLNWTTFVTLTSREKGGPVAQARMIADALNRLRRTRQFEFRWKKSIRVNPCPSVVKTS